MKQTRPKNLNLFTIRFPLPAIVSILHRITGVFLFLAIPLLLWGLSYSLTMSGFDQFQQWLALPIVKIVFWMLFVPFIFHLVAGVRHLLADIGIGTSLKGGRLSAQMTFVVSILLVILAGIWLW